MRRQLGPALRMLAILTLLVGILYPLAMTGVAQALFAAQADGSLVGRDGSVVGSRLVGQPSRAPDHFHARPSAADATDRAPSGPSNLGPNNPDLLEAIRTRAAAYREQNGLGDDVPVPIDAVTTSASGVDPHISVANARLQAPRVAAARGLPVDLVVALVARHTDPRALGFLGEPGVNVLELNLALSELDS